MVVYSYNIETTTRRFLFLQAIDVFLGGVGAIADNGSRVPEPRSGWAKGECPKLGTLLLGDVEFHLYFRISYHPSYIVIPPTTVRTTLISFIVTVHGFLANCILSPRNLLNLVVG